MSRKYPGIDSIQGPHDSPVAWSPLSEPVAFEIPAAYPRLGRKTGCAPGNYRLAVRHVVAIEPYADAVLRPEWEIFS